MSTELKRLSNHTRGHGRDGKDGKQRHTFQHQEWVFVLPANPQDTKTMNKRTYYWCSTCNKGSGQWVQADTTDTYIRDFKPHLKHQEGFKKSGILRPSGAQQSPETSEAKGTKVSFNKDALENEEKQHSAKLSLSDGLKNCFRFDVQYLDDEE